MTSTLPNDNIRNFDDQITNKLISEIIETELRILEQDLVLTIIFLIL